MSSSLGIHSFSDHAPRIVVSGPGAPSSSSAPARRQPSASSASTTLPTAASSSATTPPGLVRIKDVMQAIKSVPRRVRDVGGVPLSLRGGARFRSSKGPLKGVSLLLLLTASCHAGLVVYAATRDVDYGVPLHRSHLASGRSLSCAYEYGVGKDGEPTCSSDERTASGNRSAPGAACASLLGPSSPSLPPAVPSSPSTAPPSAPSPLLLHDCDPSVFFELRPSYAAEWGRDALRVGLVSLSGLAVASDLLKAIRFLSAASDADSVRHRMVTRCTLPLQWLELAITSSITVGIVSALAYVRDVPTLASTLLASVALSYVGWGFESLVSVGFFREALILLWQPGLLMLGAVWVPTLFSLDGATELLCAPGDGQHPLFCDASCVGKDRSVSLLVTVGVGTFLLVPSVLLYQAFVLSGTRDAWKGLIGTGLAPVVTLVGPIVYIVVSPLLSVYYSVLASLGYESWDGTAPSYDAKISMFASCQAAYALLGLGMKAFLIVFVSETFAEWEQCA